VFFVVAFFTSTFRIRTCPNLQLLLKKERVMIIM
jgi:hypothetical protein